MKDIIISGMGIVSALGNNVEENLCALRANRSGIAPLRYLRTSHTEFPVGEVKMTDEEMISLLKIPDNKPVTRTSLMGMLAVREALESAGLRYAMCDVRYEICDVRQSQISKSHVSNLKIAFINGSTVGGMDKSERFYLDFFDNDTKNAYISTHDCGSCTEMIADYFGIFSQVDTISTACSSAANAIILGAELLRSGRADIVVAGGSECLTKFHLNGFNTLMILDRQPCRPFDATRAGITLGEGAAYVVMERGGDVRCEMCDVRHATSDVRCEMCDVRQSQVSNLKTHNPLPSPFGGSTRRGKRAQVSNRKSQIALSGYANTCDAYHQTASSPDGEGAYLAMKKALEAAQLQPGQIDYINAHGTGTENNDLSEGMAIVRLFGEKIPPVSSTKAFTGHTTSAAGSVETVISILALQHNFIPANLNFSEKMPELPFVPYSDMRLTICDKQQSQIANRKSHIELTHVLCNSFGFGGNDSSLIFSKIYRKLTKL